MFALGKKKEGKAVSFSAIENQRIKLFEEQMSPHGVFFGGRILEVVEDYAKKVAEKHTETKCKTAGINFVRFFSQAKRDDILICKASVNQTWETSLEVGVKVIAEDFRTLEKKHIFSGYFTFEAIDENEKVTGVSFVVCENELQKKRCSDAQKRKIKIHKYQNISPLNK